MKKLSVILLAVLLLASIMTLNAYAAENPRVVDNAPLLSESERADLEEKLDEISERRGMDVVVVTEYDLPEGYYPMTYADDYYDYNGYADDGVLLLISINSRDWYISTKGYGITALTDYGISYIGDEIKSYLSDGDYFDAFVKFADLVDDFVAEAEKGHPYDYGHEIKSMEDKLTTLGISLAVGAVIALIAVSAVRSKYKPVRRKAEANDYLVNGSFNLRQSHDRFLYSHVTRVRKEKSSSSGGGSSTHTSSSGSSHGGGGGKF